ncbi:hypothetical protein FOA43_003411 [Brettanomyces nanus]|uniref:Uncharacterized protein n=1 Tax=Eeniella nana TaxID=13502 RepID=A0A875S6U4_EENNA|nr:uncharacterized protein FOA43_003411 [Brettanomyces nanus]QPG76025.1 hypothetical protein FOA43_003411 [Brettanomyces nanus]
MQITLCGHSAGCTLITQILEREHTLSQFGVREIGPIPSIQRAIFLDGIYNVTSLVEQYPDYCGFIHEAFGDNMERCNIISSGKQDKDLVKHIYGQLDKITVIHSIWDELISLKQPEEFINWLLECGVDERLVTEGCYFDSFGKHNDVYQSKKVAHILVTDMFTR